ncbi:MAG: hypothetical protein EA401_14085 [Planctomycetota bacterium]|nr:MAG: hypothetical protein EA401_14085 [Planctomycetota bacterium]
MPPDTTLDDKRAYFLNLSSRFRLLANVFGMIGLILILLGIIGTGFFLPGAFKYTLMALASGMSSCFAFLGIRICSGIIDLFIYLSDSIRSHAPSSKTS